MININIQKFNPNWITGFVDAEGCFSISVYNDKIGNKLKWKVIPCFQIELHIKDLDLLLQIKSFFKDKGTIYIKRVKVQTIRFEI